MTVLRFPLSKTAQHLEMAGRALMATQHARQPCEGN